MPPRLRRVPNFELPLSARGDFQALENYLEGNGVGTDPDQIIYDWDDGQGASYVSGSTNTPGVGTYYPVAVGFDFPGHLPAFFEPGSGSVSFESLGGKMDDDDDNDGNAAKGSSAGGDADGDVAMGGGGDDNVDGSGDRTSGDHTGDGSGDGNGRNNGGDEDVNMDESNDDNEGTVQRNVSVASVPLDMIIDGYDDEHERNLPDDPVVESVERDDPEVCEQGSAEDQDCLGVGYVTKLIHHNQFPILPTALLITVLILIFL
ncbi:hypothetical protein GGS26DRAFT_263912 [Hypomontagnella submonticulosa]|nr:hypothetical protein GGS26DRAFT_263912 [Hypomontagnella submonticulosa]